MHIELGAEVVINFAIAAILSEEVTLKRLAHSIQFMARKMYFSDELDPSWRTAWRKAHCFATKISSEGTAQPAFILRDGVLGRTQVTSEQHPIQGLWTLRGEWTLGDLNPRPSGCKPDALPTELSALVSRAEVLPFLSLHLEIASLESDQINSSIPIRSNTYTGDWNP